MHIPHFPFRANQLIPEMVVFLIDYNLIDLILLRYMKILI